MASSNVPRTLDPFDLRNMSLSSHPLGHASDQEDKDDELLAPVTTATSALPDGPIAVNPLEFELDNLAPEATAPEYTLSEDNAEDDAEDTAEDIDLLIAEVEEEDGKEPEAEVVSIADGTGPGYQADLLNTDVNMGLDDAQVIAARRKYGRNCLKEQRQSHLIKFLMLFVGPVQFVMEV